LHLVPQLLLLIALGAYPVFLFIQLGGAKAVEYNEITWVLIAIGIVVLVVIVWKLRWCVRQAVHRETAGVCARPVGQCMHACVCACVGVCARACVFVCVARACALIPCAVHLTHVLPTLAPCHWQGAPHDRHRVPLFPDIYVGCEPLRARPVQLQRHPHDRGPGVGAVRQQGVLPVGLRLGRHRHPGPHRSGGW
jgi:hypothetical protein